MFWGKVVIILLLHIYCALPCWNISKNSLDYIMRCAVAKSWTKFGPNYQFSPKENVLVNLNVTFIYLLYPHCASWHFTNINRVDHEIWNCINLGQFDPNYPFFAWGVFFWEKWLLLFLMLLFVDLLFSLMLLNISKRFL